MQPNCLYLLNSEQTIFLTHPSSLFHAASFYFRTPCSRMFDSGNLLRGQHACTVHDRDLPSEPFISELVILKLFISELVISELVISELPHDRDLPCPSSFPKLHSIVPTTCTSSTLNPHTSSLGVMVLSCLALPCLVLSCLVLSCLVLSCLVLSCLVLFCPVLSCLVVSCLVLSYLVLSCLVLSCLVLSYLVLSCLVFVAAKMQPMVVGVPFMSLAIGYP
jgi:hypothetical protein